MTGRDKRWRDFGLCFLTLGVKERLLIVRVLDLAVVCARVRMRVCVFLSLLESNHYCGKQVGCLIDLWFSQ